MSLPSYCFCSSLLVVFCAPFPSHLLASHSAVSMKFAHVATRSRSWNNLLCLGGSVRFTCGVSLLGNVRCAQGCRALVGEVGGLCPASFQEGPRASARTGLLRDSVLGHLFSHSSFLSRFFFHPFIFYLMLWVDSYSPSSLWRMGAWGRHLS